MNRNRIIGLALAALALALTATPAHAAGRPSAPGAVTIEHNGDFTSARISVAEVSRGVTGRYHLMMNGVSTGDVGKMRRDCNWRRQCRQVVDFRLPKDRSVGVAVRACNRSGCATGPYRGYTNLTDIQVMSGLIWNYTEFRWPVGANRATTASARAHAVKYYRCQRVGGRALTAIAGYAIADYATNPNNVANWKAWRDMAFKGEGPVDPQLVAAIFEHRESAPLCRSHLRAIGGEYGFYS